MSFMVLKSLTFDLVKLAETLYKETQMTTMTLKTTLEMQTTTKRRKKDQKENYEVQTTTKMHMTTEMLSKHKEKQTQRDAK